MDKNSESISCIIAAHNEEERITSVLEVVSKYKKFKEIIVVDDGSKDKTSRMVRRFKNVKLISYRKNKGKTFAVIRGISASRGDFLFLLDADLIKLNNKNLDDLIQPVLKNRADVSIAILKTSFLIFKILGFDFVSGQRFFHRSLLEKEDMSKINGYGFEPFMNKKIIKNKLRIAVVKWDNVINLRKSKKAGFFKGVWQDYIAVWHTARVSGIFGMLRQMFFMPSLKN